MSAVSEAFVKTEQSYGRILVVEDDDSLRRVMLAQLRRRGYENLEAATVAQALDLLKDAPIDLVISDLNLPDGSGIQLLKKIRVEYPESMVAIVTAYGTIDTAV